MPETVALDLLAESFLNSYWLGFSIFLVVEKSIGLLKTVKGCCILCLAYSSVLDDVRFALWCTA